MAAAHGEGPIPIKIEIVVHNFHQIPFEALIQIILDPTSSTIKLPDNIKISLACEHLERRLIIEKNPEHRKLLKLYKDKILELNQVPNSRPPTSNETFFLGLYYSKKKSTPENLEKAAQYFMQASKTLPIAFYYLAKIGEKGWKDPIAFLEAKEKNEKLAEKDFYLEKYTNNLILAAVAGDPVAKFEYAKLIMKDLDFAELEAGLKQQVISLLVDAVSQGERNAQLLLGKIDPNGKYVSINPKDEKESEVTSKKLILASELQDNLDASRLIADIFDEVERGQKDYLEIVANSLRKIIKMKNSDPEEIKKAKRIYVYHMPVAGSQEFKQIIQKYASLDEFYLDHAQFFINMALILDQPISFKDSAGRKLHGLPVLDIFNRLKQICPKKVDEILDKIPLDEMTGIHGKRIAAGRSQKIAGVVERLPGMLHDISDLILQFESSEKNLTPERLQYRIAKLNNDIKQSIESLSKLMAQTPYKYVSEVQKLNSIKANFEILNRIPANPNNSSMRVIQLEAIFKDIETSFSKQFKEAAKYQDKLQLSSSSSSSSSLSHSSFLKRKMEEDKSEKDGDSSTKKHKPAKNLKKP